MNEKKREYVITTLLTILYFSLPQIGIFFWKQATYHLSAHFLFLISFVLILDYSKSRSAVSFFASLLSSLVAFLTRPEFASFAIFIFFINFAHHFDFARFKLKRLPRKEKRLLLISLLYLAMMIALSVIFLTSYGELYSSEDISSIFISNLFDHFLGLTSVFSLPINIFVAVVCLLSLIFFREKREYLAICIIFYISLSVYIMRTVRYENYVYLFYQLILLFALFAHAASWLLAKRHRFRQMPLLVGIFLSLLIISSCYLVMSTKRIPLLTDNNWEKSIGFYDRLGTINQAQNVFEFYTMQKDKSAIIMEKYSGNLFYKYLFANTNNTFCGFDCLKELNPSYYSGKDKLIIIEPPAERCTFEDVQSFLIYFSDVNGLPSYITKEDYPIILSNLNESIIRPYAKVGGILICEIISPNKDE